VSLLHLLGDFLRGQLLSIPLGWARALFVLVPVILLLWIWRLPKAEVVPPGASGRPGENLRIWAALALLLQILIYLLI